MINYISSINETDKFSGGEYKNPSRGHNYKPIYANILDANLDKILEIGTASCGFAKFLKDNNIGNYLVGADFQKGIISNHIPSQKTWPHLFDDFYEGDVSDANFLKWIKNKDYKFDLVIDDASHQPALQQYLLKHCEFFLSERGIYLTEDIVSYDQARINFSFIPDHLKHLSYIVDLSLSIGRTDDVCIIIDKRL